MYIHYIVYIIGPVCIYTSSRAKRPGLLEGSLLSSKIPSRDFLDLWDLELCGLDELPETTLLVADLPLSPCSSPCT